MIVHTMKRNDTRPYIAVELVRGDGTTPAFAAGDTVRFSMRDRSGSLKIDRATAVPSLGTNSVEYRWTAGDTDVAGDFEAEWEVTYQDGSIESFPGLGFDIVTIIGDLS